MINENERRPIEMTAEEFWERWSPGAVTPQKRADFMVDLERLILTRIRESQAEDAAAAAVAEDGFDWADPDSVVVERVYAVAVYKKPNGDIVIRQEREPGQGDSVIVVPTRCAHLLVEGIQRQLKAVLFPPPSMPRNGT